MEGNDVLCTEDVAREVDVDATHGADEPCPQHDTVVHGREIKQRHSKYHESR